ncbi:MAG TPA: EamA/RhaT family transporter, partial [Rikenellaceae bacterium]|nr:EamA/RhaT family transporter [Rikenellaceae bacterium]
SCNPIGKVAIYNSLIPIVGTLTSCLCLSEPFRWTYLMAACLAACGVFIVNKAE